MHFFVNPISVIPSRQNLGTFCVIVYYSVTAAHKWLDPVLAIKSTLLKCVR